MPSSTSSGEPITSVSRTSSIFSILSFNSFAKKTFCLNELVPITLRLITRKLAFEYSRILGSSASCGRLNLTSSTACLVSTKALSIS
jgi:hypothetical protein